MYALDNRTILFVLLLVGLITMIYSFFPSRGTRRVSMNTFRAANIFYITGFLLLYLQGQISPLLGVILSNTLILTGFAMFCYTVNSLYSSKIPPLYLMIVLPLHLLAFFWFTYIKPETYLRIIIVSLEIILFLTVSLIGLGGSRILKKASIFRMVIINQSAYLLFLIYRISQTGLFYYNIESIFNSNFPTAVIFLSSMGYHISMNLIIIITLNRLYEEDAFERVRLLEQTHIELSRINSIPFDMNTNRKGNDLYWGISNFIMDYFDTSGVAIHLLNKKDDNLILVSLTDKFLPLRDLVTVLPVKENFITGQAVLKQHPIFISMDRYPNREIRELLLLQSVSEIASYPINSHQGTIGTFTLAFEKNSHQIKENEDIFKMVSIHIGSILENSELNRKLQTQASTDPLTEIANRREFLKRLDEEFARSGRHKSPLSLLMLDIDHFKKVNDTYGHDTGDFVLKEVTRRIKACLRTEDVFGRYGGEEFLIALSDCPLEDAEKLAEKFRVIIEESEMEFRNSRIRVTISIGGTQVRPEDTSPAEVITKCDTCLYEAKNTGRNRCVLR